MGMRAPLGVGFLCWCGIAHKQALGDVCASADGWGGALDRGAASRRRFWRQVLAVHPAGGRCRCGRTAPAQAGAFTAACLLSFF